MRDARRDASGCEAFEQFFANRFRVALARCELHDFAHESADRLNLACSHVFGDFGIRSDSLLDSGIDCRVIAHDEEAPFASELFDSRKRGVQLVFDLCSGWL